MANFADKLWELVSIYDRDGRVFAWKSSVFAFYPPIIGGRKRDIVVTTSSSLWQGISLSDGLCFYITNLMATKNYFSYM